MITIRRSMRRPAIALITFIVLAIWWTGIPGFSSKVIQIDNVDYRTPSYDWARVKLQYPRESIKPLPVGSPLALPKVQHVFSTAKPPQDEAAKVESRKQAVLQAFRRSWSSYKKYAWGWDELVPIAGAGKNTFGGYGASIVDALGTLWIMGQKEDFAEAVRTVALIDWNNTTLTSVNMFETTIRYLGGLLSAYDLSGEPVLLTKAVELGEMLYFGFDTPNHMPPFWLQFSSAKLGTLSASDHDPLTSGGSLSLEFTRLSQLTGNPKWYDATERVKEFLHNTQKDTKIPGMWPAFLSYRRLTASESHFTIGAQADSVYEYLPKMHALLGGLDPEYPEMTKASFDAIKANLLFSPMTPDNADILFAGDANARSGNKADLSPDMQHLSCFLGGSYALAARLLSDKSYLDIGARLTRGCVWAYAALPTGIMPEISTFLPCASATDPEVSDRLAACKWSDSVWDAKAPKSRGSGGAELPKGYMGARDTSYMLRPEAIESVFYMWRITGDAVWRDAAWDMFQAIVAATETKLAYSSIRNVNTPKGVETQKTDSTESFWFSETMKYFYLIFEDPGLVSLDDWVFNTEAHPLKRPTRG
ncbi:endoplasmic reticulum mannosyl-oligosaccharide 1,2-alpha-mannosidase [Plectosphaerella cucumerina]|uniref:alpha-1,2-Mannosidase n=1 Tax=Plectosphaerella cucumerina TaxID=40658 RepID=A0A8K0X152_9PEZI|nr:endoplasmic reticulum mannosyl-oligosaccharide 1,2-alpha-mannosidase [Plectosphaerella cucumerina]